MAGSIVPFLDGGLDGPDVGPDDGVGLRCELEGSEGLVSQLGVGRLRVESDRLHDLERRDRLGGDLTELGLGGIGDAVSIGIDAGAGSVQRLPRLCRQWSHQSGIRRRRLDLSHHLLLVEDGELDRGVGIGQSVQGGC